MIRTVSLAVLLLPIGLLTALVAIDESKPDRVTPRRRQSLTHSPRPSPGSARVPSGPLHGP